MCWNGGNGMLRAHLQHSAAFLAALHRSLRRISGCGSRSIGREWEVMILPGCEDPEILGKSKWDHRMGMIEHVTHCIIRRHQMRCYLPQGLPNIDSLSLYWHLSCLYLRTPAITQSSATMSGGVGEKRIIPSQLLPGPLCETDLSSSV